MIRTHGYDDVHQGSVVAPPPQVRLTLGCEVTRRVWASGFHLDQIRDAVPTYEGGWRELPPGVQTIVRNRLAAGLPIYPAGGTFARMLGLRTVQLSVALVAAMGTLVWIRPNASTVTALAACVIVAVVARASRAVRRRSRHTADTDSRHDQDQYAAADVPALRRTWVRARSWTGPANLPENVLAGIGFCVIAECASDGLSLSAHRSAGTRHALGPASEIKLMDLWSQARTPSEGSTGTGRVLELMQYVDDLIAFARGYRALQRWAECPTTDDGDNSVRPPRQLLESIEQASRRLNSPTTSTRGSGAIVLR